MKMNNMNSYFNEIMKRFFLKYTMLGISILSVLSCSSDLDFNQGNDLALEPVIVANLATFDIPAHQFVSGGIEQPQFVDVPNFDLFKDSFFKNNLLKVEFFFEINNTINRDYVIDLVLLDADDIPLYSISIPVPAYTGVENLVKKTEPFESSNLPLLTSTRKMSFTITMLSPGPILSENSLGSLKLRSSTTGYFSIK
jgi:hypothetical protein